MKIAVCAPVWGRPALRDKFLDHMLMHQEYLAECGVDMSVAISGSEGQESMGPVVDRGFNYIEAPNKPLGAKFNAALFLAEMSHAPDYFCFTGSDTFVDPSVWKQVLAMIEDGERYIGVTDAYLINWSGKGNPHGAAYWPGYWLSNPQRSGEPIGPMRFIHRSLMPEDMQLYDQRISSSLDASASRKLPKCTTFESKPHRLVSCKEELSITPMSEFPAVHLTPVQDTLFNDLFEIE